MPAKMTKKQVTDFISDESNWKTITCDELVQIRILDYKDLHYAAIAIKRIVNIADILLHGAAPATGFDVLSHHRFDPDQKCFRDTVSKTSMEKEIYEACRKEN